MNLRNIAAHRITEKLQVWDPVTGDFLPNGLLGRIDLTDRFLSNFNKPLRRRMLFTRFGAQMPDSRTIRHPGTQQVYLLGQTRSDARDGVPYVSLTVCHLVTDEPGGSSGLARLYRKQPAGPSADPGWLVETLVATAYADIEFRTSANEENTLDVKTQNFLAVLPSSVSPREWDYLELKGRRYRVVDVYADSGFSGMRVDLEDDPRLDFVIHVTGERQYNRATHEYTNPVTAYNVTGVIPNSQDFAGWVSESEPYVDVVVESAHIGFVPQAGKCSVVLGGRTRAVKSVSTQAGERQYRMRCY